MVFYLSGCSQSETPETSDTINIGVAWPRGENDFIEGAELAVQEINEAGGVLNKKIKLIIDEREAAVVKTLKTASSLALGENSKEIAREIARSFVEYDKKNKLTAVIGHRFSSMAIAAANIYQQNNMLYIAPTATEVALATLNFDNVFRMLPNNEELGQQLAFYANNQRYKKIVVLGEYSDYSVELILSFTQTAAQYYGIQTAYRHSFFSSATERDFNQLAVELQRLHKTLPFDAIFVLTSVKTAEKVVKYLRERGNIDLPIIGGETLDDNLFWDSLIEWQKKTQRYPNVFVPTVYYEKSDVSKFFDKKFSTLHKKLTDRYAALGYDIIRMLTHIIHIEQSVKPIAIADGLRYMQPCRGVTGRIAFQDNGDVRDKNNYMITINNGEFSHTVIDAEKYRSEIALPECLDLDQDKDGVVDTIDKCPNNKPEELVNGVFVEGEHRGCPLDSDKDGVADYHDQCPNNTPEEISKGVNELGCPVDSDNDGVLNYKDKCPTNSKEEIFFGVDEEGCPIDSDKDSVPDFKDKCPNNSQKEISKGVDEIGCPKDSDQDGVPDFEDKCPNNTKEELSKGVDIFGCPIDKDRDGVPDYKDKCPNSTKDELSKGIDEFGCSKDSDGDGIPDFKDQCPANSKEELSKGIDAVGCPIDSDKDGVPDYRDQCPNNSKLELSKGIDQMGCPIDSDGDGIPDFKDQCPTNSKEELSKGIDAVGCPIDSDEDGVPDYRDQCPNNSKLELSKGIDQKGCPKDSDKDGVPDFKDKCPNSVFGLEVDEMGCVIKKQTVFPADGSFSVGGSVLAETMKQRLKIFIQEMDITLIYAIEITAHTDGLGTDEFNQRLSEKRAESVAQYLMELGVPEKVISANGAGKTQPIADNNTEEGRNKNRRFDIKIELFSKKKLQQER
jgi:outer membrane protein OmpA-like peptidoglycan-associated protein/ABC-type branched-subunit amino acid transport system substrate-binding protein